MPKKTLERDEKTGVWSRTLEPLPSETEQKKQPAEKPSTDVVKANQEPAKAKTKEQVKA